jgi:hypothetical protein
VNCEQRSSVFKELSLGNSHGRQLAVRDSCGKKSAGEDLACDLKTLSVLHCSDIRSLCAVETRIGTSAVQFGAISEL